VLDGKKILFVKHKPWNWDEWFAAMSIFFSLFSAFMLTFWNFHKEQNFICIYNKYGESIMEKSNSLLCIIIRWFFFKNVMIGGGV